MLPPVSVIIPVCNGASYIRDARASIAAQEYPDLEVIVVDDGSTDDTAAIVDEPGFATRVIHQANAGPAAARNRGIEIATGDVFAFRVSDGMPRWSHHFGGAIRGIGCTDRVLYVGTYEGLVYAYRRAR